MRLIDKDLSATYVVEERREAFEDFVKAKSAKGEGKTGKSAAALYNIGFRDSYGPVVYERGMRDGCWVMPDSKNEKVLVFTKEKDAMEYGKSLLPILKRHGFGGSEVWVDKVAVMKSTSNAYMGSLAPKLTYDDKDRYVLRIQVR